ncbi:MAG TPA: FAD-binding protein [Candidatus Saccharimonadales bacterium]|nr:FAD-binding protein [Candidatus Saccharimonadales bacterium]
MQDNLSHEEKIATIAEQLINYSKSNQKKKIRFTHGSTNSTRVQDKSENYIIDISSLNKILEIDQEKKIAIVEPNVPMDMLVAACLKVGLIPKVVMEFPGITCGGGVNGAALEASSYKYGQFNDTCVEYECILADGTVVKANEKENSGLFYGISGSYGSIALLTSVTISLLPAKQYVNVRFIRVASKNVISELQKLVQKETYDYLDAIVFNEENAVIIVGNLTEAKHNPLVTFTQSTDEWFYLYAKQTLSTDSSNEITVPIKDFLFRYDRGAFWMGKYAFVLFHIPFSKLLRRLLDPFMHTRTMYKALHNSNIAQELFLQDFYIPFSKTKDFIDFTNQQLGIFPLWLCPIRSTNSPQYLSPHYLKEDMLIDVGIWGTIPKNKDITHVNKLFEDYVLKIGGRKMLYAEAFYTEKFFWEIYNEKAYRNLRDVYKVKDIFPTVWEKTHVKKKYGINKWNGIKAVSKEFLGRKFD